MEAASNDLSSGRKSTKSIVIEATLSAPGNSTTRSSITTDAIEVSIHGITSSQNAKKKQLGPIDDINARTESSDPDLLPDAITEAFRLAGARKVLRIAGKLRKLPKGNRRVMKSTVGSLASRITSKISGQSSMPVIVPAGKHNMRQRTRNFGHSSWSTSASSDDSSETILLAERRQEIAKSSKKPPNAGIEDTDMPWMQNLQKAAQELVSEVTGGQQVDGVEVKVTHADVREAMTLLLEKRGFKPEKAKQARVKLVSAGRASREIEMLCGGDIGEDDGPFRLTVCVPKQSDNVASDESSSSIMLQQEEHAFTDKKCIPVNAPAAILGKDEAEGLSLPGVELQRDSTSSVAKLAAAMTAGTLITQPKPKRMESVPVGLQALPQSVISEYNLLSVTSEPNKESPSMLDVTSPLGNSKKIPIDSDLIAGLDNEVQQEWMKGFTASTKKARESQGEGSLQSMSIGSEGSLRVQQSDFRIDTSSLGHHDSLKKATLDVGSEGSRNSGQAGQEAGLDEASVDSISENSAESSGRGSKDSDPEQPGSTGEAKRLTLVQQQKAAAVKALEARRREIRDRLAMSKVPLVSCPATVVRHLSEPQFMARKELAKEIIHDIRPVNYGLVLGGPGIQQPQLWQTLRLSQPLKLNQHRKGSEDNPGADVWSLDSTGPPQ